MQRIRPYLLLILSFLATLFTCSLAGYEWTTGHPIETVSWETVKAGLPYALSLLAILGFHEFGHYYLARRYRVNASLPFFIPFWFPNGLLIGTMGAVIRLKDQVKSAKTFFDIGIAGPIAGIWIAFILLGYSLTHLPEIDYLYSIHPEYEALGEAYGQKLDQPEGPTFRIGNNLLFHFLASYSTSFSGHYPHLQEIIHYPLLFAVYLGFFFTSLNLLPIGQLDGGHISFALFGERMHRLIGLVTVNSMILFGGIDLFHFKMDGSGFLLASLYLYGVYHVFKKFYTHNPMNALVNALALFTVQITANTYLDGLTGFFGWIFFAFFVTLFLGAKHPEVDVFEKPTTGRWVLAGFTYLLFVLTISPIPFALAG